MVLLKESAVARKKRRRGPNDGGTIDQRPGGRWRLRVRVDSRQVSYGTYETEEEAFTAQARWRLTGLLPVDDPELALQKPPSDAIGGVRCDQWFARWQQSKSARRSLVRVGRKRGGAASTTARDSAQWNRWWFPAIGDRLPHTVSEQDVTDVLRAMENMGRAPNTVRTHWVMVRAFFNWMVSEKILGESPVGEVTIDVDLAHDRVREIIVPDFRFLDLLGKRLGNGEDRLVFELLLGTGGRRSEVAGMMVGDVDLQAGRVWIRQPVVEVEGRLVRNPHPKGGRTRAVIVGPHLAQLLREHLMRRGMPDGDQPLLASPRGNGFRWNNYMTRTLRPVIESTAIRWAAIERRRLVGEGATRLESRRQALAEAEKLRRLTPHHLRHTAATLL
jgi:integrase